MFCFFCASLFAETTAYSQSSGSPNTATVIFYRTAMWGGAYSYKLRMADSVLTKVKFKSFYSTELNKGVYNFWGRIFGRTNFSLDVKPGKVYFVKCGVKGMFNLKPKMILLSDVEAKKEMEGKYLKRKLAENKIQALN